MRRRHSLPRLWLMTDERQGETLWAALAALPRGAGIVFRHHATPAKQRRLLYDRIRAIARARGLVLVLAGDPHRAAAWKADGAHGRSPHRANRGAPLRTAPAHTARELVSRGRIADLLFLSPVFATRSHPDAATLGPARFALLARKARVPVIALGGMNAHQAKRLAALGAYGWAAIDGLTPRSSPNQNLKAVPI
jgi:thiamine-phosphate pyrophosphorylase